MQELKKVKAELKIIKALTFVIGAVVCIAAIKYIITG